MRKEEVNDGGDASVQDLVKSRLLPRLCANSIMSVSSTNTLKCGDDVSHNPPGDSRSLVQV